MEKLNLIANALQGWINDAQEKKRQKAKADMSEELPEDDSEGKAAKASASINKAMRMQKPGQD